jgi:hypothetical protein
MSKETDLETAMEGYPYWSKIILTILFGPIIRAFHYYMEIGISVRAFMWFPLFGFLYAWIIDIVGVIWEGEMYFDYRESTAVDELPRWLKLTLTIILDPIFQGINRGMSGDPLAGALWFVTLGFFGIGWIIDIITMATTDSIVFRPDGTSFIAYLVDKRRR